MKAFEEIKKNVWNLEIFFPGSYSALVKLRDCGTCSVVWGNDEGGFEHVSISPKKQYNLPSWSDMCQLKDVFFNDDEEVYQIHPPKDEYVNISENCLHLWKPKNGKRIDDLIDGKENG